MSLPPVKAFAFVHFATPTGASEKKQTLPAGTLPALPAALASAFTSQECAPAAMLPASVVSNSSPAALRQTVPSGTLTASLRTASSEKRMLPADFTAAARSRPRAAACSSSVSPLAVCGKLWQHVQSTCAQSVESSAATACSRSDISPPLLSTAPLRRSSSFFISSKISSVSFNLSHLKFRP